MTIPDLLPGGEPFLFPGKPGNDIGVLLVHGFTASPEEIREMGEYLAAQGCMVYGPRLTHHALDPRAMNRARWLDWYGDALDGYHLLRANCRTVFVAGLSMGGLTALLLASQQPVAGVIAMSVPIFLDSARQIELARFVWRLKPMLDKPPLGPEPQWQARVDYRVRPTRSIVELNDYRKVVMTHLPQVTAPALLMHSRTDTLAPPRSMDYMLKHIGSTHVEHLWLDNSDHCITVDVDRERVWRTASAFIERVGRSSPGRAETG